MEDSGQAAGGPAKYPEHILEKYATLNVPPLNLPTDMPDSYHEGLPGDITLSRICQYIHLLVSEAPSSFISVVDEWNRRQQEAIRQAENREWRQEWDMAIYGRTYKEPSELKTHVGSRLTFEGMLRRALISARDRASAALSTPEKRWDKTPCITPPSMGWTIRGNRDGDESECSDSEDERRAREVSPSPARRPPTPVSNNVSPSKRSIASVEDLDSAKRCRTGLERLASPLRAALPSFPAFDLRDMLPPATPSSLETSPGPSASTIPREPLLPIVEPESLARTVTEGTGPVSTAWKPRLALPDDKRTVLIIPTNPHQDLMRKSDITFHTQWELERLIAQDQSLHWHHFAPDDLMPLAGNACNAVPRIPALLRSARPSSNDTNPGSGDIQVDAEPSAFEAEVTAPSLDPIDALQSQWMGSDLNDSDSAVPPPISERIKRLCAEVDREEQSIRDDEGRGMLSENPDSNWPYGGKIVYSIIVHRTTSGLNRNAKRVSSRVQLYHQPPAALAGATPFPGPRPPIDAIDPILHPGTPSHPVSRHVQGYATLPFNMTLAPPTAQGKSFRLARRFGSRRVLSFKWKDQKDSQAIFQLFVGRRFVLFGRVFRALWAPSDKNAIFAVEVHEEIDGLTWPVGLKRIEPVMPTYCELIKSFNDLELKAGQAMAKWAARPQLLFTDSVPALKLNPDEIAVIDDVVVGEATTEQTLTDGCGLMTESVARQIGIRLECDSGRPTVVQIRLGGAKGLLILMSPDQEIQYPGKSVLLRKSMVKSLTGSLDPSLNIIDVVRCGNRMMKTPVAISSEPIIALVQGGVSRQLILRMAKITLEELTRQFLPKPIRQEDTGGMRQRIASGVYNRGGVMVDRKKRLCLQQAKSARAAGLVSDHTDSWQTEYDEPDLELTDEADVDHLGGHPSSLAESLYMAVDAGFDPRESVYACGKLRSFMENQINSVIRDFRIPIAQSLSAFIVPDPCGVLEPHEIFVACSSRSLVDPVTGCPLSHILGPVLAYRSPCKLPSDVQKFTAVYRSELRHLTDCIVMSTSSDCKQSPASFMAGGDYDGDTATVIFDPALVEHFAKADDNLANTPPGFLDDNFEEDLVKGSDFLGAFQDAVDEEQVIANYQVFLLGAMLDERATGLYSKLHDNAVYTRGHSHPETIRLARMFSLVLDARKSGLRIKGGIMEDDGMKYGGWLEWRAFKKGKIDTQNSVILERLPPLRKFIMDMLKEANEAGKKEALMHFPTDDTIQSSVDYDHLSTLWLAKDHQILLLSHKVMSQEFETLRQHVNVCKRIWDSIRQRRVCKDLPIAVQYRLHMSGRKVPGGTRDRSDHSPDGSKKERDRNPMSRQFQELAKVWHEGLTVHQFEILCAEAVELQRLKISLAAEASSKKSKQLFPFDMDFTTTLQMKAEKVGPTSTTLMESMLGKKPTWRAEKR